MKTQTFKGKELTYTKVKNNILKVWNMTSESDRFDWYKEANLFAENIGIVSVSKACGVLAALSPVKTWEQNKKCAVDCICTGDCGHMAQFKNKAVDIINSDGSDEQILSILNGRKISSFYLNIRHYNKSNIVTIDRHALSIALGCRITDKDYQGMTAKQYSFFVRCYVLASIKAGVSPLLVQSATWVYFRNNKNLWTQ